MTPGFEAGFGSQQLLLCSARGLNINIEIFLHKLIYRMPNRVSGKANTVTTNSILNYSALHKKPELTARETAGHHTEQVSQQCAAAAPPSCDIDDTHP